MSTGAGVDSWYTPYPCSLPDVQHYFGGLVWVGVILVLLSTLLAHTGKILLLAALRRKADRLRKKCDGDLTSATSQWWGALLSPSGLCLMYLFSPFCYLLALVCANVQLLLPLLTMCLVWDHLFKALGVRAGAHVKVKPSFRSLLGSFFVVSPCLVFFFLVFFALFSRRR